jgi:hypothetical protein
MPGCARFMGALLLSLAPISAHAVTTNFTSGATVTSVAGAATFINFDGIANASTGTVSGGLSNPSTAPNASANWIGAFGTVDVTVTLANPVSYFGFDWGTPDAVNTVQVFDGANPIATITGSGLTGFHDSNGGFFDIFAGSGEAFTSVVFSSANETFELDNFAASRATTPLPGALPLFATGLGALGLLGWRRKKKAATLAA